ncbi:MAG: FAD:protein FMN transferase [Flavobacteriaceae bacterium]
MKKVLFLGLVVLLVSCQGKRSEYHQNYNGGPALGTSYNITYLAQEELDYQKEIDSVFEVVNRSMSTYIPDSDISRINNGDTTVRVDQMFREVFELSKEVHDQTDGYFDPTVGVLVNAWGFGPGEQITLDSTKVDSLLNYVGFSKVSLSEDNRVMKKSHQIRFDFNAVAKGYAIDRLAVMLDKKGISDYLVEVGGEIVAKGENSLKGKPWSVGIEDPQKAEDRNLKATLNLKNRALASSGNYRKFRIDPATGIKYVHTVDPKTGFTKNSNILGVNILAKTCARADAFATAFMAMDLEASMAVLEQQKDLDAYIIYLDEKGEAQEYITPGFSQVLIK